MTESTKEKTAASKFRSTRHPDDPFIDSVRIQIVERYKTSGISGDEWRFSYVVEMIRKGACVASKAVGMVRDPSSGPRLEAWVRDMVGLRNWHWDCLQTLSEDEAHAWDRALSPSENEERS